MKIFLSSTYEDLVSVRQIAIKYLKGIMGDIKSKTGEIVAMEYFEATQRTCKKECLHELESSNLVIGIYGERYGSIDEDTNLSMTELEFDYAITHDIPLLAFVMRTPNREVRESEFIRNKVFKRGLSCANFDNSKEFLDRLDGSLKDYLGDLDGYSLESLWGEVTAFKSDLEKGVIPEYGPHGIQMPPFGENDEDKVLNDILFSAQCVRNIQADLSKENMAIWDFASKCPDDITEQDVHELAFKVKSIAQSVLVNWEYINLGLLNHAQGVILGVTYLKLKRMEHRLLTEPWTEELRREVVNTRSTYLETIRNSKYQD